MTLERYTVVDFDETLISPNGREWTVEVRCEVDYHNHTEDVRGRVERIYTTSLFWEILSIRDPKDRLYFPGDNHWRLAKNAVEREFHTTIEARCRRKCQEGDIE